MIHSSFTSYHVALKLAQSKQIYAFSQISWKSGTVTSPATSYTYSLYLWSWNSPSTSLCMFSLSCTQTPGLTGHHFVLGLTLYFFHGTIANEVDLKPPGHLCNDREVVKITKMNVLHWSVVLKQVLSSLTPPPPCPLTFLFPDLGAFPSWYTALIKMTWYISECLLCACPGVGSNGSGTSEDLFWKLDALQTFIRDLHWPEEEFAKHLESRLKLMSSDMIESCVKRWDLKTSLIVIWLTLQH